MNKNTLLTILLGLILFAATTGISYFAFSRLFPSNRVYNAPLKITQAGEQQVAFDQTAPKTEECPLNGVLYSKDQKDWWEKHRPLGVMIENHEDARPQSGLSYADAVYEAVAEGGITRFLAVFYCQDAGIVGPVRSARTYFLDFISEYGSFPLYAHVGGANAPGPADALSQIDEYGWGGYNDLNQFSIGFPTFWRDYDRLGHTAATEHTMYSSTQKLWDLGKTRGLTNVDKNGDSWNTDFSPYSFKDDVGSSDRGQEQNIHLEFWTNMPAYFVDWKYDPSSNLYKRFTGGKPHIDNDNKKQLTAKNIVVLYMQELNANDGYENNVHLLYDDKGSGKADVFLDGKRIKATWKKNSRTGRTLIIDANGNQIKFDRGLIWFSIMPTDGAVTVK